MTLFKLQMEVELGHLLEDLVSSFFMGLRVRVGDEEIVYVDDEPSLSDHVIE